MSLTVQQLLSDAKRLSSRLRDHDQSADHLISRAQEVLKEVDAMRQYQEDVENLNEVAHNRPRAQLVLGIQQENRHIRTLQQENKELRAALEEHQNALELIMSKYRQHVTKLVNNNHPDVHTLNNQNIQMLAERTEKVCEMAAVMKEAVRVDEETCNQQQELMARLITENKGLRELLEISQRSSSSPRVKKVVSNVHKEVQTETITNVVEQVVSVTLPMPAQPKPPPRSPKIAAERNKVKEEPIVSQVDSPECAVSELSSGDSDETGSEDESVKFDTIKLADRKNKNIVRTNNNECIESQTDGKPDIKTVIIKPEEVVQSLDKDSNENKVANSNSEPSTDPDHSKDRKISAECISKDTTSNVTDCVDVKQESSPEQIAIALPMTDGQVQVENEGQQNQVLVGSLVQQLVRDSVETSTGATSITTDTVQAAASDTCVNMKTIGLSVCSNLASDTVKSIPSNSELEPSKDKVSPVPTETQDTCIATPSSSSSPSQQQPAKTVITSKAESSPNRGNSKGKNKKSSDKGNKNSPKKNNKK